MILISTEQGPSVRLMNKPQQTAVTKTDLQQRLGVPTLLNEIQQNILRTYIDMNKFIREKSLGNDAEAKRMIQSITDANMHIELLVEFLRCQNITIPSLDAITKLSRKKNKRSI